jgi:hypothetical protein
VTRIVECYSGVAYDERPEAFLWEGERRKVDRVVAASRTPAGKRFDVMDDRSEHFILTYDSLPDQWRVIPGSGRETRSR